MHSLIGEQVLMRIHIGEADKHNGRSLYSEIIELLRRRELAGATVFRGAMSFGNKQVLHSDRVEVLAVDLPLVVECVDTEQKIRSVLPELDKMIGGGLITLEKARVLLYRAGAPGHETVS